MAAAKLAAVVSVGVLVSGLFTAIRRGGGTTGMALVLSCLPLALPQGLSALLLPAADALAAGLAVWGLAALQSGCTPRWRLGLAALLFTLALLTKLSTLAAPAAAFFWLLRRDWRKAVVLSIACVLLGIFSLGLLQWSSQGRFLDNLRQLGSGGGTAHDILLAPVAFFEALCLSRGFLIVFPIVLAAIVLRLRVRPLELWDWYFLTATLLCLLVFASPGTADNHLLELEAAGILVLASWAPGNLPALHSRPLGPQGLGAWHALVLLVLALGLLPHLGTWRMGAKDGVITAHMIDETVPDRACLLTETPLVPVLRGQHPVVMDPFAFRVLAERGRIDDAILTERIRQHEFDVLILLGRIDEPGQTLCPQLHFGPRVTQAILDNYHFQRELGVFTVFVPNS